MNPPTRDGLRLVIAIDWSLIGYYFVIDYISVKSGAVLQRICERWSVSRAPSIAHLQTAKQWRDKPLMGTGWSAKCCSAIDRGGFRHTILFGYGMFLSLNHSETPLRKFEYICFYVPFLCIATAYLMDDYRRERVTGFGYRRTTTRMFSIWRTPFIRFYYIFDYKFLHQIARELVNLDQTNRHK